jgi:hypothetical protein
MPTDYDTDDNGSQSVLDMHRRKNRPIRPPNPNPQSHVDPAFVSRRNTSTSHISNKTHGNKNVARHADTFLHTDDTLFQSGQLSRHSDVPFVDVSGAQSSGVPAPNDRSDPGVHVPVSAPRRTRSCREPLPSHIGFYEGHWVHVLVMAKSLFRYYIHTNTAFPERNDKNLEHACECLVESIEIYTMNNEGAELDKS